MPVTDAYATPAEYRAVAGSETTIDDLTLKEHLATATRFFERESGQFFGKDAAAVIRVFVAKWWDRLDLTYEGGCPGIADITNLEIKVDTDGDESFADETAWSASDYRLWPYNADKGPEPRPWTDIEVSRNSTKRFSPGNLVQVTAIYGWPTVPAAVKSDVIELCRIWRAESPRSTGRMNELEAVVNASELSMSLVRRIRDAYRGKVAL